jgi:hypothetical protein
MTEEGARQMRHRRGGWHAALLSGALAMTIPLTAACSGSGSPKPATAPGDKLYHQAVTYSRCMRTHGVTDFPMPAKGPQGTLIYPVNPPSGMLSSASYDPAFRACLKLAVIGGGAKFSARYQAIALHAIKQAECMRAHGITGFPSPATLNGGIHDPDFPAVGVDANTLRFQAAGQACGVRDLWRQVWWWPAGSV